MSFYVDGRKTEKGAGTNSGKSGTRNVEAGSLRSRAESTGGCVKWNVRDSPVHSCAAMGTSRCSVGRPLTSLSGGNRPHVLAAVPAHCKKFLAALHSQRVLGVCDTSLASQEVV